VQTLPEKTVLMYALLRRLLCDIQTLRNFYNTTARSFWDSIVPFLT